jgi:phosphopantetheine adenylyltransferase
MVEEKVTKHGSDFRDFKKRMRNLSNDLQVNGQSDEEMICSGNNDEWLTKQDKSSDRLSWKRWFGVIWKGRHRITRKAR